MSTLRTARLALRPPQHRDVPRIVAGCSDPEVTRYIPTIPVPYTAESARTWLATADECAFAITEPPEDELLGVVAVRLRPGGSLGYWLLPDARGHGLTVEAVREVARWAVEEHGVTGLHLTAHPDNVASQRVAERAGFTRAGLVDHDPPFRDGTRQAIRFER